jgi:hypothetical protein
MRSFFTVLLTTLLLSVFAQNDEKAEVLKVVNQVFEAMRTSDSTLLKDAFVESPTTYTIFTDGNTGETRFRTGEFQKFIDAVGQPKEDVWNEPIWNEKVEIDGKLASAWVEYAFYLNDKFLHCGVDAFHLVKSKGKWKIFHLVDTRRRASCEVPEEVKKKLEGE